MVSEVPTGTDRSKDMYTDNQMAALQAKWDAEEAARHAYAEWQVAQHLAEMAELTDEEYDAMEGDGDSEW
jgi:hypothetical protein